MKFFFLKLLLLLSPIIILIVTFLFLNPFGIFNFNKNNNQYCEASADFIAIERYLKNTINVDYNSYVFGNSKVLAFQTSDWKEYIGDRIVPYNFGSPGESVNNIYNKLKLIESQKDKLNNALIILDEAILKNYKNKHKYFKGPAYMHHPLSTGDSWLSFYGEYFMFYISDFFFLKYIDYSIFKTYRSYHKGLIKNNEKSDSLITFPLTNEFINITRENSLLNDPDAYFLKHRSEFYNRPVVSELFSINSDDVRLLREIQLIFKRNNTDFKIVLGPNYDQAPFNRRIYQLLIDIFGKEKIFDFTGINDLTEYISNYYESSHYRPKVGRIIMDKIYN